MLEKNSQNIALLQYCNGLLVHVHAMDSMAINPVTHYTSFVRLVQVEMWKPIPELPVVPLVFKH